MKQSNENMKLLLEKIQYEKYNWKICGDVKVIALFLSCTEFCCFLCEWDSRDRKYHCIQKEWHKRKSLIPGQKNVVNTTLTNPGKRLFTCVAHQTWTHIKFRQGSGSNGRWIYVFEK
jgi:hypothetical protein